jgi:hypothetical protein
MICAHSSSRIGRKKKKRIEVEAEKESETKHGQERNLITVLDQFAIPFRDLNSELIESLVLHSAKGTFE